MVFLFACVCVSLFTFFPFVEPLMQCIAANGVDKIQIDIHKLLMELPLHILALQMTDESGTCRIGANSFFAALNIDSASQVMHIKNILHVHWLYWLVSFVMQTQTR